ncbi:MAG: carboxy terminal-processing peptidase, partial [Porticoccaceae bacterium]|nr:carboxy terminal-processing peptidase [Porticoccaceae bacterium]
TSALKHLIAPLLDAHNQRSQEDPDYAYMLGQMALTKSWAQQDALSLNIETRRARSKKWDEELFTLENKRRSQKGLDLFANVEAWKEDSEADEDANSESEADSAAAIEIESDANKYNNKNTIDQQETEKEDTVELENIAETDPLLQEAGQILTDQIRLEKDVKNRQLRLVQLENKKAS